MWQAVTIIRIVVLLGASIVGCSSPPPAHVATNSESPNVPAKPVEKQQSPLPQENAPAEDPDAAYQLRQMHLIEWIEKAQRDCERTKSTDAWLPEREGFPPDEIELVKRRCAEGVEKGYRGDTWVKSMSVCADRYARAKGRGKHECRLTPKDVPELPPELFDRHKVACNEACARAGEQQLELQKERSQFVRCCDGTTSPSCTYGTLHSGCCSGHQGVCIPD